ncbi:MAG: hypothetical protein ACYSW3_00045 [Planctomycetota bacterium]
MNDKFFQFSALVWSVDLVAILILATPDLAIGTKVAHFVVDPSGTATAFEGRTR